MKLINFILLLLLAALQYRIWAGQGGVPEVMELAALKAAQLEENQALEERNLSLLAEVIDLKEGMDVIEERARSEMGMIKEDETFYRIIPRDDQAPNQMPGQAR